MIILPVFAASLIHFSLRRWLNILFERGSERVNPQPQRSVRKYEGGKKRRNTNMVTSVIRSRLLKHSSIVTIVKVTPTEERRRICSGEKVKNASCVVILLQANETADVDLGVTDRDVSLGDVDQRVLGVEQTRMFTAMLVREMLETVLEVFQG